MDLFLRLLISMISVIIITFIINNTFFKSLGVGGEANKFDFDFERNVQCFPKAICGTCLWNAAV